MSQVIDELFESKELDGTQRPPVAPVHVDLQLARLFQRKAEPVLEIFLKKSALQVNGFMMQNDIEFSLSICNTLHRITVNGTGSFKVL